MKARREVWISALCLLSTTLIIIGLRTPPKRVLAAHHATHQSSVAQPAVYMPSAALSGTEVSKAMLLDDDLGPLGQPASLAVRGSNPVLPEVETFTLIPPNPAINMNKTLLAVRFHAGAAEKLAAEIPMTLGSQKVILQRSPLNPNSFTTLVDFDWTAFLKQQQHRQQLASQGKTVPIYKGRDFLGLEKIQFVDPETIEAALQSQQAIQFSPRMLISGDDVTIVPSHQLMIVNPNVVEDGRIECSSGRTYDACLPIDFGSNTCAGNAAGAWAFQTLWLAILNTTNMLKAEEALESFLQNWENNLTINTNFPVPLRVGMTQDRNGNPAGLISNWPIDPLTHHLSLVGPLRLTAIVNRIDLGGQPDENDAGELRFIFGVTANTGAGQTCFGDLGQGPVSGNLFNIILEYKVPPSWDATTWANQWNQLPADPNNQFPTTWVGQLQTLITDNVVKANCTDPNNNANSCLFHIRTNEIELTKGVGLWEQREFAIQTYGQNGNPNTLVEETVAQTPDSGFNFAAPLCASPGTNGDPCVPGVLTNYINQNQTTIDNSLGTALVPQTLSSGPFLGGSVFNAFNGVNAGSYWNGDGTILDPTGDSRRYFSLNTCNGCHGAEAATFGFQQVENRRPKQQSLMSNFLLGCVPAGASCGANDPGGDSCQLGTSAQCQLDNPGQESVPDPSRLSGNHSYGDILRRMQNLQTTLSPANELFLPFIRPKIGSVH